MSAILSARLSDSVQLLADGAAYLPDGTITGFPRKIICARRVPVAIAIRGYDGPGQEHAERWCEIADRVGADDFVDQMRQYGLWLADHPLAKDDHRRFDILGGVWSPTRGPYSFRLHTFPEMPAPPAYLLLDNFDLHAAGTWFAPEELIWRGIWPVKCSGPKWGRTKGVEIFEMMRTRLGENLPGDDREPGYRIGGHVDVASVSSSGVRITRALTWPDTIGQKIDPFAGKTGNPSRQQHRAAERKGLNRCEI